MADWKAQDAANKGEPERSGGGLSREMGIFSVLIFALCSINLATSGQVLFGNIAGVWPGSSLLLVILVALVACLFHAYTYAMIGSAATRAGADYYVASRSLSAPLAFASSWTFVICSALAAGALIAAIPQTVLPLFFRMFGMIGSPVPAMIRLSEQISSVENVVLIGTVLVVVTFLLTLLPPKVVMRTLQVGFVLILTAWGLILYSLFSSQAADFPPAWDKVMGAGSYLEHLIQVKGHGIDLQSGSSYTLIAGLFVSFWLFYGYSAPTSIAGEVKKPERSLLGGSVLALLLAGGILWTATSLMLRLVPAEWLAAESYLYQTGGLVQPQSIAMPSIVFFAAVLHPNPVLMVFLFVAWLYAMINMAQAFYYYCSRVMLSWVEDRMLPEPIGYLHPNLRSPLMAVLVVAVAAEGGVILASLSSAAVLQLNLVFLIAGAQLVPVLAISVLPFTRPDWFEKTSGLVRARIGKLPVITLVGAVTFVFLAWLWVSSMLTRIPGGRNNLVMLGFVILFITGLGWYYARKLAQKSEPAASQSVEKPITG